MFFVGVFWDDVCGFKDGRGLVGNLGENGEAETEVIEA